MSNIFEDISLRNKTRVFSDRFDAGQVVADMLVPEYKGHPDLLVLGIPMGGIPLASEIAKKLERPMDLVIVRKIQVPGNTESGFGAMTEEGDVFLNKRLMRIRTGLTCLTKKSCLCWNNTYSTCWLKPYFSTAHILLRFHPRI
jgi:hypothetical protein